jgi:hypothetical protein
MDQCKRAPAAGEHAKTIATARHTPQIDAGEVERLKVPRGVEL